MFLKKEKKIPQKDMIYQESLPKSGCQLLLFRWDKSISNFSNLYFGPVKAPFQIGKSWFISFYCFILHQHLGAFISTKNDNHFQRSIPIDTSIISQNLRDLAPKIYNFFHAQLS